MKKALLGLPGGGASGAGGQTPLQTVVKTVGRQAVPFQPMEVQVGVHIHTAAHGEPHVTAGGHILKEATACGEPTLEEAMVQSPHRSRFSGRTCGHARAVCS